MGKRRFAGAASVLRLTVTLIFASLIAGCEYSIRDLSRYGLDEAGIRALEFKMVYYGVWKIQVIRNSEKVLPRKCLIPSLITLVTDIYKI